MAEDLLTSSSSLMFSISDDEPLLLPPPRVYGFMRGAALPDMLEFSSLAARTALISDIAHWNGVISECGKDKGICWNVLKNLPEGVHQMSQRTPHHSTTHTHTPPYTSRKHILLLQYGHLSETSLKYSNFLVRSHHIFSPLCLPPTAASLYLNPFLSASLQF